MHEPFVTSKFQGAYMAHVAVINKQSLTQDKKAILTSLKFMVHDWSNLPSLRYRPNSMSKFPFFFLFFFSIWQSEKLFFFRRLFFLEEVKNNFKND